MDSHTQQLLMVERFVLLERIVGKCTVRDLRIGVSRDIVRQHDIMDLFQIAGVEVVVLTEVG